MNMDASDEFYVGYLPQAPPRLALWVRRVVAIVGVLAAGVALTLAGSPAALPDKVFEFLNYREFVGWIDGQPYPNLVVGRPGEVGERAPSSRYVLVTLGKRGAALAVAGLDGKRVKLQGSLIYRGDQTMIEILDGSLEVLEATSDPGPGKPLVEDLGRMTLRGEIVDSKCFLGVMAPRNLKPHRACATRCVSGGIPPILLVRDRRGQAAHLLLVGSDGRALNQEILEFIAEPLEITGRVVRHDDLLVLEAEPSDFIRLE